VAVGKTEEYKVVHVNDRWWIIYSGELIGYFMDNFWNGSFTNIKTVAWYGEVASGREKPCIDMGNGKFGGKPGAALIEDMRLTETDSKGTPHSVKFTNKDVTQTNSHFYNGKVTANRFSYGGPGGC